MRSSRFVRLPIAALVGFSLLAAACGGGESSSNNGDNGGGDVQNRDECNPICTLAISEEGKEPIPGGALVFGVVAETNTWNPVNGQWAGSGHLIAQTFYDRLAMYDEDNNPSPYLAESIESNDTFDEWTIKVRSDVEFHDGTPLTGEIVVQNLEAQRKSVLIGPVFQLIDSIEVDPADSSGLTVKLRMSAPWSTFPHVLTSQPGSIVAPSVFEDESGGDNPVGTGPFKFVSWTRDSSLVVERNPNYWRAGYPLLDRITFRVITDGGARSSAVLSGDVDAMETSEADTVKAFFERAQRDEYQIYFADEGDTDEAFVMFNTTKKPFDDPVLRRAAIQAIDTEEVNDQVYDGLFIPARGPIAPTSDWYFETEYPEFDAAAAKTAIEAWEDSNGRPMSFTANVPPDPAVLEIAQLMKDLASNVGVDVELNTMEQTRLIVEAITGNYESTGFAQIFNVAHPDGMYAFLHSSSIPDDPTSNEPSLNFPRYANGRIDAALDGARATDDPDEQRAFYDDLQQALAEDTPYLWLVHIKAALVAGNHVRALTTWTLPDGTPGKPQLGTRIPFYQVWVE